MKLKWLLPTLSSIAIIPTTLTIVSCGKDTFYIDQPYKQSPDWTVGLMTEPITGKKDHQYTFILNMSDWWKLFTLEDDTLPWWYALFPASDPFSWPFPIVKESIKVKIDNKELVRGEDPETGEYWYDQEYCSINLNEICEDLLMKCKKNYTFNEIWTRF